MQTQAHLLLVSEEIGNSAALRYAQGQLDMGCHVTWICSTPSSKDLVELEQIAAMKNTYMAGLNLLVITNNEKQPFAVLTGELDQHRLAQCSDLLFDRASVTRIAISSSPKRQDEIARWLAQSVTAPTIERLITDLSVASAGQEIAPTAQHQIGVTVIHHGRETKFDMDRSVETLLDGAEDAGIDLPYSCRGGVCSTCRTLVSEGEVQLLENYALEDWELEAGYTLPCQAIPISSKITLDYDQT